jgi:hypothetical protein
VDRRRGALADVYVELWRRGYYFPGGACGDVHMAPYTDGAFINVVDRDIPLAEYYKDKLPQLLVPAKQHWDPHDFFKFEMSIPLGS